MRTIRVFHPCLPTYDNLGDIVANGSIVPLFAAYGLDIELMNDDIWERRSHSIFLDEKVEEINRNFDMIMIGPGGFLGPKLIGGIFKYPENWDRLTIPLVFNGVGIVASIGKPIWYSAMNEDSHVFRALSRAAVVSVRESNSWLLASRSLGGDDSRLFLSGCPSIYTTRLSTSLEKTHDLALNISFMHEVCKQHAPSLMAIVKALHTRGLRVRWICHSQLDAEQATGVNRQLDLNFEIVRPKNADETGAAYGACHFAIVTRFHAGVFCLANCVPFAFIGYDMKCWHLLSMLVDEPYHYLLPIDRLAGGNVENDLNRMLDRLVASAEPYRMAEDTLLSYFDTQRSGFMRAVVDLFETT